MKKLSISRKFVHIASTMVVALAVVVAAAPCSFVFYQPETPANIKARVAAAKDSE
jgi:hypothetical protein